jgi:hypothetical protein
LLILSLSLILSLIHITHKAHSKNLQP